MFKAFYVCGPDEIEAQIGDWVRFHREGKLQMGVVNYIGRPIKDERGIYFGRKNRAPLHTDNGTVFDDEVLEIRRAHI